MFSWETGLGPVADQIASVEYKRIKARDLVRLIEAHRQACTTDPVHIVTHSAGSAIGIYALEQMPDGQYVDNMALLAPSISAGHDLTRALRHIRGRLYVFSCPTDAVLLAFVPVLGTADDVLGSPPAGLNGFDLPRAPRTRPGDCTPRRSSRCRGSRSSRPRATSAGITDVVNAAFVRNYVARRVMGAPPPGK